MSADNSMDPVFDSLEALADAVSEVLDCPITIEDSNHRLVAYSSHDPNSDPVRIATIIGRRVPEAIISRLWQSGVIKTIMDSEEAVRIPAIVDIGLGNRTAIAIRKNSDILGYIWVLEDEHLLDEQKLKYLKKAAAAARSKLLQQQTIKRKEEEGRTDLFWQLVTGHLKSDVQIKEKASQYGVVLPLQYRILVFQFAEGSDPKLKPCIQYILMTTHHIRLVFHIMDGSQLILMAAPTINNQSDEDFTKSITQFMTTFIDQIKERFSISPVEGSSGYSYKDYSRIEDSYKESLTVLQVKKAFPQEIGHFLHYAELGYYQYLPTIWEQKRLHNIENLNLKKLRSHDREHSSSFLQTLEVFLCCDSHVKKAADALHVHPNTLNYRLKRIAEIGDIDLENADVKMTLYLDFKSEAYGAQKKW